MHAEQRDDDAGKADHRADGEIEFACDHEETGADRDDDELGGNDAPIHDAIGGEHAGATGHYGEIDKDKNGAGHGTQFRAHEGSAQGRLALDALVGGRYARRLLNHFAYLCWGAKRHSGKRGRQGGPALGEISGTDRHIARREQYCPW